MKQYVVYISSSEAHKQLLCTTPSEGVAMSVSRFLNDQCINATTYEDHLFINDFLRNHGINIELHYLCGIAQWGNSVQYKEVTEVQDFNYNCFDNSKWDDFGLWGDDEPDLELDAWTPEEEYEYVFDHNLGVWPSMDLSNINQNRLEKFVTGNNKYKRFDPEFAAYEVKEKFVWHEDNCLHDFANNKGYRNAINYIDRMVAKEVAKGGASVDHLIHKIRGNKKYKHDHTFRVHANRIIKSLTMPDLVTPSESFNFHFENYVYMFGSIWTKEGFYKYHGFRFWDPCHCGEYHD